MKWEHSHFSGGWASESHASSPMYLQFWHLNRGGRSTASAEGRTGRSYDLPMPDFGFAISAAKGAAACTASLLTSSSLHTPYIQRTVGCAGSDNCSLLCSLYCTSLFTSGFFCHFESPLPSGLYKWILGLYRFKYPQMMTIGYIDNSNTLLITVHHIFSTL